MDLPTARAAAFLAVFSILATLPSCLVRALWRDAGKQLVHEEQRTEQRAELAVAPTPAGDLVMFAEPVPQAAGSTAGDAAPPASTWRLRPREMGDEAKALLQSTMFRVEDLAIELQRRSEAREVFQSDAQIDFLVSLRLEGFAATVDESLLPMATLQALHPAPVGDYLQVPLGSPLPGVMLQCTERLVRLDLSPLVSVGPGGRARLCSYCWVDADRHPVITRARAITLLGPDFEGGDLVLGERLQRTARLRLLVVVERSDALPRAAFLLRPDAVWLWGALHGDASGRFVSHSRWSAEPLPVGSGGFPTRSPSATISGRMCLVTFDYHYERADDLALRVLATPIALALDLVGLGALAFLCGYCGDDDDEHTLPTRRR